MRTSLTERLGIAHPVVLAPMGTVAGGRLAAAVTAAGGLGLIAGGYGYVPWITKAPTVEEKHVVAQIVKDELRHATVMYGLLADLGRERP